ncbi:MAG: DNA-processing protein DprA [Phocaeicola sp.]
MVEENLIYTLALTRIKGVGLIGAKQLLEKVGDAKTLFTHRQELKEILPDASPKLIHALDCPEAFKRAEEEVTFAQKNRISCLTIKDEKYPARLRECPDAPLVLFYRGNSDLNSLKVISMVGTRYATSYGEDICNQFIEDLAQLCPGVLIVSGLAYGIDIYAHRAALKNGVETIGVLAHGLDRIYPQKHRKTAIDMMEQGGLITEFMSQTNPDRQNFVKRNRVIAGMSDATLVIESAAKGGALITAEIAESYHRDCFAFPGRINDPYSIGCNKLIKENKATLLTNASELVEAMKWEQTSSSKPTIQRELFPELTDEEKIITSILQKNKEGSQINRLVIESNIPIQRISGVLFELEMKGVVRLLAGGVYKLYL